MATKSIIHYVTNTLETETPVAACGIKTNHANSTENAPAVTCQRCLRTLNRNLDLGEKKMATAEEIQGEVYQITSEGVELDTAQTQDEAIQKAEEVAGSMPGATITVVHEGTIVKQTRVSDAEGMDASAEETTPEAKEPKPEKRTAPKRDNVVSMKKTAPPDKPAAKKVAPPAKKAAPKADAPLNECVCGCGATTKGTFAPGHDGRVHGWMKKIAKGEMKLNSLPPVAQKYIRAHSA